MEHWPGHEKPRKIKTADDSKDKGKRKEHIPDSNLWQWPHLEHGSIGRITLVPKDGKAQCSSTVDISQSIGWRPLGTPTKIFPETRSPQVDVQEYSARQRVEEGLHYLRTHFPDADFPGELLGSTLESDDKEMNGSVSCHNFLGNRLAATSSHHTQDEYTVIFPMGELGRDLNISRLSSDSSGNMVFTPTGSPALTFETPILQISSIVESSEWTPTQSRVFLVRTHTASSLCRLEGSKVTRELDVSRAEVGNVPIVDSGILACGPDTVIVNRDGKVYKCNMYGSGKVIQQVGFHEVSDANDFWQIGVTPRDNECFIATCKTVKHIDLRAANPFTDVLSLDHPDAVVTSFESPIYDHTSRVTTTSDVIWLDDRFRRRPLLSYKHYRSFDRTLRLLTGHLRDASLSLLTSRTNGLVTLYDVGRGTDNLLHCNSIPSCLPQDGSIYTVSNGHALVVLPSREEVTFLRLCQHGSIYRQDLRVTRPENTKSEAIHKNRVTHEWSEDVQKLAMQANELCTNFGPAGGKHYTRVDLRSAYRKIFTTEGTEEDAGSDDFDDTLTQLAKIWRETEGANESMITRLDLISCTKNRNKYAGRTDFFAGGDFNAKQAFHRLVRGQLLTQELVHLAPWHYNIRDTAIPFVNDHPVDPNALNEHLKELNLVFEAGRHNSAVQRETEARERLVLDLTLSNDVYSTRPVTANEEIPSATRPLEVFCDEEPPEIKFGYFRPIQKAGANHYVEKEDGGQDAEVSSPLGVRLLLAEWQLGTDPQDYNYRDPYGVVDADVQPIPQYRRLSGALQVTQKKQTQPQRPPPVIVATNTQPPVIQATERSEQITHLQQQFKPDSDTFSQEPMTSTQVLPGPFGGRQGAGKKPVKKRVGGF